MSNETYRMYLIGLPTIELIELIHKTNATIKRYEDCKEIEKHRNKEQYKTFNNLSREAEKKLAIQKVELQSRQMKLF